MYEGIRGRSDVKASDFSTSGLSIYPLDPLDTHSIDRVQYISGSYPVTASVNYIKCRNSAPAASTDVTSVDWYEEHFRPVSLLYDHHVRYNPERFLGYHDYFSLYFQQNLSYNAPIVSFTGSGLDTMTSSFTVESWIKPTYVTSSAQDYTIMSQRNRWKLYITGSTGAIAFTDFATILTSSVLTPGIWTHVAFSSDGASGSFYLNATQSDQLAYTGTLGTYSSAVTGTHLTVGAEYVVSASADIESDQGFRGFIYENRIWDVTRTLAQISSSWNRTLKPSESGSADLIHYSRFNDGPLAIAHGYTQGSGAFDYSSTAVHGYLINFRSVLPVSPIWQPNDNLRFSTYKTQVSGSNDFFRLLNVPVVYYGSQIATGSVELECHAYENQGLVRKIKDDGRGGLYISGSLCRPIGNEDYKGVSWRKVGDVFYGEGIIVITDPSLWDFGETSQDATDETEVLRVTFEGFNKVPVKVFMCRIGGAEFNCSNNPSFSYLDPNDPNDLTDDQYIVRGNTTYVTAIGFYDDKRNLVAVAKIAQPIRNREKDKLTIRCKMDW